MPLRPEIREFLRNDARSRFLRYVRVHTTSDEKSTTAPSTERQWDLLRILASECSELGLADVHLSDNGFVYATLPARPGAGKLSSAESFALLAHVDTSPEQPGENVKPVLHERWDGKTPIRFPDDPELTLTVKDSPELAACAGDTIITASGTTLLGADDKAGVAEIMAAAAALRRFPELSHGEIRLCFTRDEEIGRGVRGIDLGRLPRFCYTMDGSEPGELEDECFDARRATVRFRGVGVHPGYAYGRMVNAALIAGRFLAELPAEETPERAGPRDGFYYVYLTTGSCERAELAINLRDFERSGNDARAARLAELKTMYETRYPGLAIELIVEEQYQNMRDVLARTPEVVELARRAIEDTGIAVRRKAIRGGTDGSVLSQLGHPTPNIFAGGMLFHSRREWIAERSLALAAETIVHLARHWTEAARA